MSWKTQVPQVTVTLGRIRHGWARAGARGASSKTPSEERCGGAFQRVRQTPTNRDRRAEHPATLCFPLSSKPPTSSRNRTSTPEDGVSNIFAVKRAFHKEETSVSQQTYIEKSLLLLSPSPLFKKCSKFSEKRAKKGAGLTSLCVSSGQTPWASGHDPGSHQHNSEAALLPQAFVSWSP